MCHIFDCCDEVCEKLRAAELRNNSMKLIIANSFLEDVIWAIAET
jgi:hypothetical protein